MGHDLIMDVTRWKATVNVGQDWARSSVELSVDPRSLQVREGLRGIKPLADKDRAEIRREIDDKVLRGQPINFRSTHMELADDGSRLSVRGELEMVGNSRAIGFELDAGSDGRVSGNVPVAQSEWGIKPYRGLMGALKVRDSVEVMLDARLPPG